ncbi:DUF397 domain-containing protein [Streptomyces sp. NPDC056231]|uniref:DUF397 domain-containing protein n=1 Tax=Streptomyces sp. NPDC056231 TaxID=3345755 RepID=UPI003AB0A146
MHPASIGALDGLPSDVRDDANRVVLAEQRAAKQAEYDAWLKKEPDTVHVRDSKATDGPSVAVAPAAWAPFLAGAVAG